MPKLNLETIAKSLNADSAAIMMPNDDQKHLFCFDSYNMPPEWIAIKNPYDENISGGVVEVYKTGNSAVTNHLRKMVEGFFIESVMVIPIKRASKTVAVLEIIHNKDDKIFSDSDKDRMLNLANLRPSRSRGMRRHK